MRVRFSATSGGFRLGRARLALIGWLAARACAPAGAFVLRLSGEAPGELAWLGIVADETIRLADRAAGHAEAVAVLTRSGRLYPCFESEEELRSKRDRRIRQHKPPLYDRAMLKLTPEQRTAAEAGGKRPYWRFLLADREASWRDRAAGPQGVKLSAVSDPVVVAADGTVSAALAAAIDDARDGIDLLVRETSQLEATGLHLDMLDALGAAAPALAHLPPLPEALATIPLRRLRQDGIVPSALRTWLAAPMAEAPLDLAELVSGFGFAAGTAPARRMSMERLRGLNRRALAATSYGEVADLLPPDATESLWLAVRDGLDLVTEARQWCAVVGDSFLPPKLSASVLATALTCLPPEPWDTGTWATWVATLPDIDSVRLALTGESDGPDLARLLPLIGRARAERRLRTAM